MELGITQLMSTQIRTIIKSLVLQCLHLILPQAVILNFIPGNAVSEQEDLEEDTGVELLCFQVINLHQGLFYLPCSLIGPTLSSLNDPYVLVGSAHCNFICKDSVSGIILETCCCRPESNQGTCNFPFGNQKKSPFCIGDPIFTQAKPSEVEIICGEYNTEVQVLENSEEPEQVFTVTKITNHPSYQTHKVNN